MFLPSRKGRNIKKSHLSSCREVFPTKMTSLPRKWKSLGDDTDQHICQEYQVLWAHWSALEFQHKATNVLSSQIAI